MIDFIVSALPFVILGVCLAIMVVSIQRKHSHENYMAQGMCFGMCMGVTFASVFDVNMGLGISLGMMIGETIGCLIKKDRVNE